MDFFERTALGITSIIVLLVLPYFLLALAVPYAVLKARDGRHGPADPQLGIKVGLQFFFSLSLLLVLTGLTVISVDLVMRIDRFQPADRQSFPNPAQKLALGLIISGLLFGLLHFLFLLTLTTQPFTSPVRRTFLGWRFAIHGLVVMTATTLLFVSLFFMRGDRGDMGWSETRRFTIGMLLVWLPSWFLHFVLLRVGSPPGEREPDRRWEREPDWERRGP